MLRVLNYEETRDLIRSIIDNAPDGETTEATCMYVADEYAVEHNEAETVGQPVCVVGHLFVEKFGVQPSVFIDGRLNGQSVVSLYKEDWDNPIAQEAAAIIRDTVQFTQKARTYLDLLQAYQDDGHPWGRADAYAARYVEDDNGAVLEDE